MVEAARFVAAISLLVTPGAWLAYGLPLRPISFGARLGLACVLSPVVIAAEFYALRAAGISFHATAWLLVAGNAAAVWLIARAWPGGKPSWMSLAASLAMFLLLAACVAMDWVIVPHGRTFMAHTFLHTGIIYQFPMGALRLEDPELAGVPLGYPWLGHVYWAVVSWVFDWPPTRSYVLTNLAWLAAVCSLFMETCRALGASRFASRMAMIWLALGTNAVGYAAGWGAGKFLGIAFLPGDIRYTPWLRKFIIMEQTAYAVCLFMVLPLVGLWALRTRQSAWLIPAVVALGGIGLLYPNLFPAALAFCGLLFLAVFFGLGVERNRGTRRRALLFLAGVVAVSLLTVWHAQLLLQAKTTSTVVVSPMKAMLAKSGSAVIALAPFLVALFFVGRRHFQLPEARLLLAGALASILLGVMFRVGMFYQEYKFMFASALLTAAVASVVVDAWVPRRISARLAVGVTLLLLVPAIPSLLAQQGITYPVVALYPEVGEEHFWLRLKSPVEEARWMEKVQEDTPANTAVVVRHSNLYLPLFTRRAMWVPPEVDWVVTGHWIGYRLNAVDIRGYPGSLYDGRKELVKRLYAAPSEDEAAAAVSELLQDGRPLALVFEEAEATPAKRWLEQSGAGRKIFEEKDGKVVWLVTPEKQP